MANEEGIEIKPRMEEDDNERSSAARKKRKELEVAAASGMAWGAKSFSAAKISSIREKDPGSISDFGRYMAEKRRKLHVQYDSDSANKLLSGATAAAAAQHSKEGHLAVVDSNSTKNLFKGVSIWVDGFTIPSHQELRHLMLRYGGIFENYFRRDLVTHIICCTLPDSKIKDPRSLSRGLPIVRPEWIVDSIAAARVLPWGTYQPQRIAFEHPHQRTLQSSFKHIDGPAATSSKEADPTHLEGVNAQMLHPHFDLKTESGETLLNSAERLQITAEGVHVPHLPSPGGDDLQPTEACAHRIDARERPMLPNPESLKRIHEESGVISRKINSQTSSLAQNAVRTHSTIGDKNFVQNYYKNSRLHFIGTWRNRYQSLVGALARNKRPNNKLENPDIKATSIPTIIHIDMDCFFVAVVIRERRELDGKPVAVCHSDSARGTAEISSANYPARSFGIRAGMFVRDAKACCPDLEIVPYNFEAYEQVADQVYDILHCHCSTVQAVSCDEAFLDMTGEGDPNQIATTIRQEIFDMTKCTASAGIAGNMLLARLATRKAKPNGQFYIPPADVEKFMAGLSVEDLPGVGWMLRNKLHSHKLYKCSDLLSVSKSFLQREFGQKTGNMLWSYARGSDVRQVQPAQERKSIGAEVNWGVRFLCPEDAEHFLVSLSHEVSARLQTAAARGRTITLKVKRRKEGEGEPVKFMGCGVCDSFSRSESVACATDSAEVLLQISRQLFNSFHLDVCEVRGVGLQVTKLESVALAQPSSCGQTGQQQALESWLAQQPKPVVVKELPGLKDSISVQEVKSFSTESDQPPNTNSGITDDSKLCPDPLAKEQLAPSVDAKVNISSKASTGVNGRLQSWGKKTDKKPASAPMGLPPISEIDPSVLASLPPEILAEIQEAYGELLSHPLPRPSKSKESSSTIHSFSPKKMDNVTLNNKVEQMTHRGQKCKSGQTGERKELGLQRGEPSGLASENDSEIMALPPASQLDLSVMEALPLAMRRELEQEYKRQRPDGRQRPQVPKPLKVKQQASKSARSLSACVQDSHGPSSSESAVKKQAIELAPLDDLWLGSPPKWVTLFKGTKVAGLNSLQLLSEHYVAGMSSSKCLSSIFLSLLPCLMEDSGPTTQTEAQTVIQSCVELVKQYTQLTVAHDVEEVYMVMRIMKRMGGKSSLWKAVEDLAVPSIQVIVGACYGGVFANY
ncbi:hypothetical protein CY35_04G041900 [Sphagnum magellanicum]|nr:hypothetical protein CY35_04G041900 [Sphagnum magellanicum]KAH9564769.1 hypothetical protein CY35_04G041900 [Sphagnum magellanicum]